MTAEDIKKIRGMMEFLVKSKISKRIKELSHDEKKVYNLVGKGQKEMVKLTGFAAGKISKIWQKLEFAGLLIKEGQKYKKMI